MAKITTNLCMWRGVAVYVRILKRRFQSWCTRRYGGGEKDQMRRAITKSQFLTAWQCKKKAYYAEYREQLGVVAETPSEIQQELLLAGTMVGKIGREYFPNGIDCEGNVELTQQYIEEGIKEKKIMTLYEAAFHCKEHGIKVSCDILTQHLPPFPPQPLPPLTACQDPRNFSNFYPVQSQTSSLPWHLYEVKSSAAVKEIHLLDASIQYWTLRWLGLPIQTVNILSIDSSYIRQGPLDIRSLFAFWNCTFDALKDEETFKQKLQEYHECLDQPTPPDIAIGNHCKKPYPCPYIKSCHSQSGVPSYSVLNLVNSSTKHWKLFDSGIKTLKDIPTSQMKSLSFPQLVQVLVEKHEKPYYNIPRLKNFLSGIKYPISFLDFESFSSAIPPFDNTKPYQAICFQYSLHILTCTTSDEVTALDSPTSNLLHLSFLADGTSQDPRHAFLLSLLSHLSNFHGTILVYNRSFESRRLKELGDVFPDHKPQVDDIIKRMVDLALPFQSRDIVTKEMKGKYSIKAVLPALVPSMAEKYQELQISNGYQANVGYLKLMDESLPLEEKELIRNNLLKYCELDTLAMVKILEELQQICQRKYSEDDILPLQSEMEKIAAWKR